MTAQKIKGKQRRRRSYETHGMTGTREYQIWRQLIQRCTNPSRPCFKDYGGRGVTVCDRWRNSFTAFHQDMGDRPVGKSIDRIDNDGPYAPENCRWASRQEQANNRRSNRWIEVGGDSLTVSQWSRRLGGSRFLVPRRLRRGWPEQLAVTLPIGSVDPIRVLHKVHDHGFGSLTERERRTMQNTIYAIRTIEGSTT